MARTRKSARCIYKNTSPRRRSTLLPPHNVLSFPRGGKIPHYCDTHTRLLLSEKTTQIRTATKVSTYDYKSVTPLKLPETYAHH